jgi:primosomal protein N' (replication factor Y) (superfamily II helicase)
VASPARRSASTRPRRARPAPAAAASLPVARVAVDVSLAHLDRPFDYLVPERLRLAAVPGCRVRVRFAGRLTGGYLLERADASDHQGSLAFLERVVSPEPVLTAEIAALARAVADRYGGTLADVLRLAIPPRHARAESAGREQRGPAPEDVESAGRERRGPAPDGLAADGLAPDGVKPDGLAPDGLAPGGPVPHGSGRAPRTAGPDHAEPAPRPAVPGPGTWARYPAGTSFLAALADGRSPRAVWSALPGPDWPAEIARAAASAAAAGRGALIVVPDGRDLDSVDAALAALLGAGSHVCLSAGLGPAERYRRWLTVLRGGTRIVAGTRSAMFAPVTDLGLVVLWDDGDDLHAEPRAPYPHAREVLAIRAHRLGAAALIGGFARTAEATQLVAGGWAHALGGDRAAVRRRAPLIIAAGDDAELARDQAARSARMPGLALRTAREALAHGPVLFQVPRRGYVVAVACQRCHARAQCAACGGPLALPAPGAAAFCRWCAAPAAGRKCPRCGHTGLRALVTGAGRTAEELGRAFPALPVRTSGRTEVITEVPSSPAVVVATPGAEPRAGGGYAAAILLDGWMLLGRVSLRAAEEALRRWMNAAALVRPGAEGGSVIVVADSGLPAVQALIRWDPVTHAERELAERTALRFPPAVRMASLTGPASAVREVLSAAALPESADVLGPVPAGDDAAPPSAPAGTAPGEEQVRALIRVPRSGGLALAAALRAAQAVRSARKDAGVVRLQLDPAELI